MERYRKLGFVPIGMEDYIQGHLKRNPGSNRKEIEAGFRSALVDYKAGVKCRCGSPIWVIGSVFTGNSCFTCTTGQAIPDGDYEIDEAM